jgi:hypothetical protein
MFFVDQSSGGIRVREIAGQHRSEIDRYILDNFTNAFWRAFDHEWYIPDKNNGRCEILDKLKKLAETAHNSD